MESHRRVLGILYIVTGVLQLIGLLLLRVLISSFIPFLSDQAGEDARWVFDWLVPFITTIATVIIMIISIPSVIGGAALLYEKSWALTLLLIIGCFKLFSFPIGTAIGVYTIWVYAENKKMIQSANPK